LSKKGFLTLAVSLVCAVAILAIPFSGCAPAPEEQPTYDWKMGVQKPEGSAWYAYAARAVQMVAQESDGRIDITLYGGGLLGDWDTQSQNVGLGTQDMFFGSQSTALSPKWGIKNLYFMVKEWDDAAKVYSPDGWVFGAFQDIGDECDLKFLGFTMEGFSGISNSRWDPGDTGAKNLKCRTFASPNPVCMLESIGFDPVTMPWSEIHSGLTLGTIDAMWGAASADDFMMFADAGKYAYYYHTNMATHGWYMNLGLYNSLSKEDQAVLDKVGGEWSNYVLSTYKAIEEEKFAKVAPMYDEVIELTREQWNANARVVRPQCWPLLEEALGTEIMDLVRANADPI